jgi:cellobiose transport system substrate-binding protein
MSVSRRRLRGIATAALAAGMVFSAAACSASDGDDSGEGGQSTVTLQYFGSPGFDKAVAAFQAANPDIKVDAQNMGELKDFTPKLNQWLATGQGAGDVVMLEEGTLLGYLETPDKWTNLLDLGAASLEKDFLPYKWANGFTSDKSKLVGLGTDIGGLAMCYRTDLFKNAGLPTDRAEVSKLWPTWDEYAATGKRFKDSPAGKDVAFIDTATAVMQPYIMQKSQTWFYDTNNNYVVEQNPVVKEAWDFGLKMAADGLTGKLQRWQPDWNAAFANAAFATVPCPAWMTGSIAERAGANGKGKWDIATIPGGSGNWGGSYLAIPEQSKKKDAAYKLLTYLTGKDGELSSYAEKGNMPSNIQALDDPAFKGSTNEYFSNAPTGEIFGASAKSLAPIYLGPKHQPIWENYFETEMRNAEQGKKTSDEAWTKAVADGKKLAEG